MTVIKPIVRESLSETVYRTVREALVNGDFEPGETLRISTLAKRFGTSSTPVREAIFRLVSDGVLEMTTATSVKVEKITTDALGEILEIRKMLEGKAAAHAAQHITKEQLIELKSLHEEFMQVPLADTALSSKLNRQFHFRLIEIGQCDLIFRIVENLWVRMGPLLRLFHQDVPATSSGKNHLHYLLLKALEKGDGEGAMKAMQDDISNNLVDWLKQRKD